MGGGGGGGARLLNKKKLRSQPVNTSMPPLLSTPSSKNRRTVSRFSQGRLLFMVFVLLFVSSCAVFFNTRKTVSSSGNSSHISEIEVLNVFPHDPQAFTQGLVYAGNDTLYESTGLHGKSSVRRVALQTGKVEMIQRMDASEFGEGLTLLDDRLYQVTWLTKTGFIYDRKNLSKVAHFTHKMQDGWGLATDGKVLFGSDGSSTLYQMEPKTLQLMKKLVVRYNGHQVHNLNELEYVNGEVWANVWMTDCIARISHKDGSVVGWILLQNLRESLISAGNRDIDVLNGIAWDDVNDRIFVSGKLWPRLYEIKLHPAEKRFQGSIEQLCMLEAFKFG